MIESSRFFLSLGYWLAPRAIAIFLVGFFDGSLALAMVQDPAISIVFEDVSEQSGIQFVHSDGGTGKHFIVETVCSGIATFDYDGDGLLDIYFLNGSYPKPLSDSKPLQNRLYRNLGDLKFKDVTDESGVGDTGHGLGVAVADYDNDGDPDIYVSNFGPNVFYQNNGDGTFSKIENGPATNQDRVRVGAGAAFLDADSDGNLDLYVGNYIQFTYEKDVSRLILGIPAAPGPKDYDPDEDQFFRNNGDGTFTDLSIESGIAAHAGPSMGLICLDYDQDGDTDVFVCNDSAANFLWNNDGTGKFTEMGQLAGVAYDYAGLRQANMGVDGADYDLDGWIDLVSTNFQDEIPAFYRNSAGQFFDEIGASLGLGVATRNVTWGVVFADFDRDRYPDLFMASGHLIDAVEKLDSSIKFATKNHLLRNQVGKKFVDISSRAGDGMQVEKVSRAAACEDLDLDGDLDLIVLNLNSTPTLLRNDTISPHHWIQLNLIGTHSSRDAIGARVTIQTKYGAQVQEVMSGRGYQSHYGHSLYFGVGDATLVERIEVKWLGGKTAIYGPFAVDSAQTLVE